MKLLLDEHHSPKVAAQLVKAGFDVVAASSQEHTRNITDEGLLALATADHRVIVTENIADLTPLSARWAADGRTRRDHPDPSRQVQPVPSLLSRFAHPSPQTLPERSPALG